MEGHRWARNRHYRERTTREALPVFVFLFFSIFEIGYLIYSPPTFSTWRDWIIVAGAILFPIMATISWRSMRNNWSTDKEDQTIMQTLGYIVLAPILVLIIVIAGFALFSAFGWFATIPSWAAVIIILLVLIYLKK
jgi:protein-S-isoprenylcysteine O-methyltransferase Ste14